MMRWFIAAACVVLCVAVSCVSCQVCNVQDYGAKGDNVTVNTNAIQKAIDDCAAKEGGGIVLFPDNSGTYSSGSIFLADNIILHLGENTTLSGVWPGWNYTWFHYPKIYSRGNGFMGFVHASLVNGGVCLNMSSSPNALGDQCLDWKMLQNVTIEGPGTIDGVGWTWWTCGDFCPDGCDWSYQRPTLLGLLWINNLLIQNIHITNSPFWTTHPTFCNNVTVLNAYITAPATSHNTDGFDPDSCSNVHVSNTIISVGDDCVAINSGKNEDGVIVGIPAINHTFVNVTCLNGHGMSIGSGMSGNVTNILFKNCTCDGTNTCPRIKTALGRGGWVYNVTYEDLIILNMQLQVLEVNMFYPFNVNDTLIPHFSNITMRNFVVGPQKGNAGLLLGLHQSPITNLVLENINIDSNGGWQCENTYGEFINVEPPIKCNNTYLAES